MTQTTKVFPTGRSQPDSWADFFALDETCGEVPADFMGEADRNQGQQDRDPFEGMPKLTPV